jgi:hypothetical protein
MALDPGMFVFFFRKLQSIDLNLLVCKICRIFSECPNCVIQIAMSSSFCVLSRNVACMIFRSMYNICGINSVDLVSFNKKCKSEVMWFENEFFQFLVLLLNVSLHNSVGLVF